MTLSPDGGFPTRVPLSLGGAGHFLASQWPDWSPGGEWISYVSDKSGSTEIWLWSVMDGQEIQLTNLGARIGTVSWAPNGRWITFSGDRYGNMDVWKVAVPGGEVERLTTERQYEVYPAWTPDSRTIVYVRLDDRWADHDVIEISANGENPRVVLEDRDFFDYGAGSKFGFPSVSPDGSTILFRSHRTGWINYWVAPLAGGEPRPLAPAAADQSEAMWSPDGHYVLYVENHNGTHDLRMVPARGRRAPGFGFAVNGRRIQTGLVARRRADQLCAGHPDTAGGPVHDRCREPTRHPTDHLHAGRRVWGSVSPSRRRSRIRAAMAS